MNAVIIGLGEVGSALYEILQEQAGFRVYGYDKDPSRTKHRLEDIPSPAVYLHIAIPFRTVESFVEIVKDYADRFSPRMIFVHSTVAPGTSRRIHEVTRVPVVYTPVRGKHPNLKRHILFWPKWIAVIPNNDRYVDEARRHLESAGMKVRVSRSVEGLELAKLWETVYRAVMIAAWQEVHRIARRLGADIGVVAEFVAEVHRVLKDRPVYYPGYIGGHCLIPNTEIINGIHPSKLFQFVLESNERRAEELRDPEMAREVEELKRLFLELTNRGYYEENRAEPR